MQYRLVVLPLAKEDISNIYNWYEDKLPGLGDAFIHSIDIEMARILKDIYQFPIISESIRRTLISRFPYGIYYKIEQNVAYVIAVTGHKQQPLKWKSRK